MQGLWFWRPGNTGSGLGWGQALESQLRGSGCGLLAQTPPQVLTSFVTGPTGSQPSVSLPF